MAKCVLVVDDSETVRQVLQLTLSNAGFDVIEAEDGDDALNKLSNAPVVDMLITDLNMPNMDGLELIKKIMKTKNTGLRRSSCSQPSLPKRRNEPAGKPVPRDGLSNRSNPSSS